MEYKDLPPSIQRIAAYTLRQCLQRIAEMLTDGYSVTKPRPWEPQHVFVTS